MNLVRLGNAALSWSTVGRHLPHLVPAHIAIPAEGEELIFWLIVLAIIAAIVLAILYIGVFVLAGVAIVGAVIGLFTGLYNFFAVLVEAHQNVK